jgi:hypothetical protein
MTARRSSTSAPLWIALLRNSESHDFVKMMNLARELASERQIGLTVLSTNIEPEVIYQLNESVP